MAEVPPASPVPADATVEQLLALLAERDRMIERLVERITQLEARLGRNWQNSSQPPSADAFVKPPPRSLRRRSGRKPGKSDGERGFHLQARPDPDEVQIHRPTACCDAGPDWPRPPWSVSSAGGSSTCRRSGCGWSSTARSVGSAAAER